jgi:uncharacterized membrane protein YfcA
MEFEFHSINFVQLAVVIFAVVIAYTIKGLSGFGAGLIAIPILSTVLPVTIVVPAVSLLSYGANLIQSFKLRQYANWRDICPLIPFCLFGVLLAVWLLVNVNSQWLALAMGLFVMAYGLYSLLPIKQLTGSRVWAVPFGGMGGFIGALFGSSGFIYVTYLKLRPLNKTQFRASVAMALTLDGTFRISGYIGSGLLTSNVLILVGLLFPVLLLSIWIGNYLHLGISPNRFNQVVSTLLISSGAILVLKSI